MLSKNEMINKVSEFPSDYLVGYGTDTKITLLAIANSFSVFYNKDFDDVKDAKKIFERLLNIGLKKDTKYSSNIAIGIYVRRK